VLRLRSAALPIGFKNEAVLSRLLNDVTAYLVIEDLGELGRAFVETDLAQADRETIIRNFISGQYKNALRVIAFNTAEGWSRDRVLVV
jgi:hypothetical protein